MSAAGIQSNRGDGYQTLVAFDWALTVLADPAYEWIEVDSVEWLVDDVVIRKLDGTTICCQCKKNQSSWRAWSVSELRGELKKAISLLERNKAATVRFYSRSNFGDIASLQEYARGCSDQNDYQARLAPKHHPTDAELALLLTESSCTLSAYELLVRTEFVPSDSLDRMRTLLHERLGRLVSDSRRGFDALWTRLDHLGMRLNHDALNAQSQHRLTKEDIRALLNSAGSLLAPEVSATQSRATFKSISAVGRPWRREIANELISTPLVDELFSAVEARHRSILLTGLPGSGKTCVMLALQEKLEDLSRTRCDLIPLFIQSREFADLATAADREAQGLPTDWVEQAARLADDAHVVVVIDSLDVVSISREHGLLGYFLAQIDRLLQVSKVTVVAACRTFDRHYDRRLANRKWDKELACRPFDWNVTVEPLLRRVGIDPGNLDATTRELVCNPRELDLFVELSRRSHGLSVAGSQELVQRYLTTVIGDDPALGSSAMQAIEAVAEEMLLTRSLAIAPNRVGVSDDMRRRLESHNVLHRLHDGSLTFGHQTLLDVLVVSRAKRNGTTLGSFISKLPPVPFVRPAIRSFVIDLSRGERPVLRKQLRTVLAGDHPFHIRRLVAEVFAERPPSDDDWSLLRDLRRNHREVFQVVYTHGSTVEWHQFWLQHLVPELRNSLDVDGLLIHAARVSQWKATDPVGVSQLFIELLDFEELDEQRLAWQVESVLSDVTVEQATHFAPVLSKLLALPKQEHSFLGKPLAQCLRGGGLDDSALWAYIASEVREEDIHKLHINNKLRCKPHEFGEDSSAFLADRMKRSTALLEMAVADVERWCLVRASNRDPAQKYLSGLLHETSYGDSHRDTDYHPIDSLRILMDAMQSAVIAHAEDQSSWWNRHRERLCYSSEGALRYFGILACTSSLTTNLDLIGELLRDKELLESELSYELGNLIRLAFPRLNADVQDAIEDTLLSLYQRHITETKLPHWVQFKRVQLLLAVPRHVRSLRVQAVLDQYPKTLTPLDREPDIYMRGGMVLPPFEFPVFLELSDSAVVQLLAHYHGYKRNSFDDSFIGGEDEVGSVLREAASRQPRRFIRLLSTNWSEIADRFRDEMLDGVATYLLYQHGNLKANATWTPAEQIDPKVLAGLILDELCQHNAFWRGNRSASNAIEACSHVVSDIANAERLISLAMPYADLIEPDSISRGSVDLVTVGINMAKGRVAESVLILANHFCKAGVSRPASLPKALRLFASDKDPAVRAVFLRRLPYFQSQDPDLGWDLFDLAMKDAARGLWSHAERCLYFAYHTNFQVVAQWLERLCQDANEKDLETYGRIGALASLSNHISLLTLLESLNALGSAGAWRGAVGVWTHPHNARRHPDQCFLGLEAALSAANLHSMVAAKEFHQLFTDTNPPVAIPSQLLRLCFEVLKCDPESQRSDVYGFSSWVNAASTRDPVSAIEAMELYLMFLEDGSHYVYDLHADFPQLLTRLFAHAEEVEDVDSGATLQRVVAAQDRVLALGINGVDDWLKAAERRQ